MKIRVVLCKDGRYRSFKPVPSASGVSAICKECKATIALKVGAQFREGDLRSALETHCCTVRG